jgi:endonuclease/exonuclease/phosphatase family metal-dependent hydrolase
VRVVTYNMRAGLGGLEEIIEDLRNLSAGVIALQEVERGVHRSKAVDQAATVAEALGMQAVFASSFKVDKGEHGIAILSRWPIVPADTLRLPQSTGRWPRVALLARIEAPQGPFLLACLHLTRPFGWPVSGTRSRLAQIATVLDRVRQESIPVVLAGDLNCLTISPEAWSLSRELAPAWQPWRDGWANTFSLESLGWPGGAIKIDHIFHDRRWSCRGTWVAPKGGSDHRAVVADLVPRS